MGGGLLGWGAGVCAAIAGSGMLGTGSLRAAGFDADTAGRGTAGAGSGIAEEWYSRRRGLNAWFHRRQAGHVVCGSSRRLLGTDIIDMSRAFVRARLVSEEDRRTVDLIIPDISWGASGVQRMC